MRHLGINIALYALWGLCGVVGALLGHLVAPLALLWGLGALLGVLCGLAATWAWSDWRETCHVRRMAQIARLEHSLDWYAAETAAYTGQTERLDT